MLRTELIRERGVTQRLQGRWARAGERRRQPGAGRHRYLCSPGDAFGVMGVMLLPVVSSPALRAGAPGKGFKVRCTLETNMGLNV